MTTFLQGTPFNWHVSKDGCTMTLFNGYDKIVLEAENRLIHADAAVTAEWKAGQWQYQIVCPDGLLDEGILTIQRNLALAEVGEQTKSHARVMLEAVEAVIEGRATTGQSHVTVGDKSLRIYERSGALPTA